MRREPESEAVTGGIARVTIVGRICEIVPEEYKQTRYLRVVIEVGRRLAVVKVLEKQISEYRDLHPGHLIVVDGEYESIPARNSGGHYNQVVAWKTTRLKDGVGYDGSHPQATVAADRSLDEVEEDPFDNM